MISNVIAPKSGYPVMYRCNDCERHFIEKKYRSYFPYRSYETKHYMVEDISDRDRTADSGADYTEQNNTERGSVVQDSMQNNESVQADTIQAPRHLIPMNEKAEPQTFLSNFLKRIQDGINNLPGAHRCPVCGSKNTLPIYGWIMF